jgi:hypothetical protein
LPVICFELNTNDGNKVKAKTTAHNRTVYASPPVGGSASATARSIASLIPTPLLLFCLRHSSSVLEMLRISLFGPPNRRQAEGSQQPERYAKCPVNFSENI